MTSFSFLFFQLLRISAISLVLCLCSQVPVLALLSNPEFADADGDGIPDGWEVKNFIMEKYRKIPCLSLKFKRYSKASVEGEVSTQFQGAEGFYRVTISYLDEYDGSSKGKFLVNDKILRIWDFDNTFADVWRDEIIENVELKPGDKITFRGRDNPSEYCRIRAIRIEPSPTPPTAQELEERNTPPVIEEKEFGELIPLRDVRDVSGLARNPEYQPRFSSRNAPILVWKKKGEEAVLELDLYRPKEPKFGISHLDITSTGRKEADMPMEMQDLPYDSTDETAVIRLPVDEEGLFKVQTPSAYIHSEAPYVLLTQTANEIKGRGHAEGAFYFFVPKGTTAFGIGAFSSKRTVEVVIHAPDGSLVTQMDVSEQEPEGLPIRVRPGQDDAVWSVNVSGVAPAIRLIGIPPYLATHPSNLLVPKNSITKTK